MENNKIKKGYVVAIIIVAVIILIIVGSIVDNRKKAVSPMDANVTAVTQLAIATTTVSGSSTTASAATATPKVTVNMNAATTSLLVPANAAVLVVTPNGGETWNAGSIENITWRIWERTLIISTFDVSMVPVAGSCIYPNVCATGPVVIAKNVNGATSTWQVGSTPNLPIGKYKAQVCFSGTNICDMSDNPFVITATATSSPACPTHYAWNGQVCAESNPVMPRN